MRGRTPFGLVARWPPLAALRAVPSTSLAPALLVLLPFVVALPLLLGVRHASALLLFSGLAQDVVPGPLGGSQPTIDPNMGFTSQALGVRAVLDLVHGQLPWWNPFEGVGVPLAGEMQSAALFPLTLLLGLPGGQLVEHVLFQVMAGLFTYAVLRRLGLLVWPAFAGGACFAFNGVFAWLGNAVVNPVAFLPMLLLGLEDAAARARLGRAGGVAWIAAGIALSLYAGFPEVAYLDGLLALVWAVLRAATLPSGRLVFLGTVAAGGLAGVLLAAPVLVAFADYLPLAEVGMHQAGTGADYPHIEPRYLVLVALPYLLGESCRIGATSVSGARPEAMRGARCWRSPRRA